MVEGCFSTFVTCVAGLEYAFVFVADVFRLSFRIMHTDCSFAELLFIVVPCTTFKRRFCSVCFMSSWQPLQRHEDVTSSFEHPNSVDALGNLLRGFIHAVSGTRVGWATL